MTAPTCLASWFRLVRLSLLLVVATACGGGASAPAPSAPTTTPAITVTALAVTSTSTTFSVGGTYPLLATATFSDASTRNVSAESNWQSSSTAIATVSTSGVVSVLTSGDAEIRATYQTATATRTLSIPASVTPPPAPGVACGVERWDVKTLSDANASRVDMSSAQPVTIQALNALASHCSGLPDPRTFAPEFQLYETTGRIVVVRSEDDRDYHLALAAPDDPNSTIVTELADVACAGAATSLFRDALTSARAQFETFRAGQSLSSLTGSLVTVRGVGFYDFNHGQTGRSQSCLELHPVTYFAATAAPAAPVINSFSANHSTINYLESAVLDWSVSNATSVSISNGIGAVAAVGQRTVTPSSTTTYTLTASNSGGSVTSSTTVTVVPPSNAAPVVNSFSANHSTINYLDSVVLDWSVSNSTSVTINNGIGAVTAVGQRTVTPSSTTTYTLTASNSGSTVTGSTTVTVVLPSNSCPASSYAAGTTAVFTDGTTSKSQNRSGTCSSHGGVRCWICPGVLCGG